MVGLRRGAGGELLRELLGDPACAVRRATQVVDEFWEGKVLWPPYYLVDGGVTYEKALVANLLERGRHEDEGRGRGLFTTESPSAEGIQAAELRRAEVVSTQKPEFDLETEDLEALKAQVERYRRD